MCVFQFAAPIIGTVLICGKTFKFSLTCRTAFIVQHDLDFRGLHGIVRHSHIGRQLHNRCVRRCVIVQFSELMEPDQVKSIYQLFRARVRRVVTEQELAAVINNCTARGRAARVCIPVVSCVGRRIHAGNELLNGSVNVVHLAEGPDDAAFFQRVALLCGKFSDWIRALDHWPTANVVPVRVGSQQGFHGNQRRIIRPVYIFTVTAARGVIHEPRYLEGSRVGHIEPNMLCHTARTRLVFIRGHSPIGGNDNPQARALRRVLAGAVDTIAAPQLIHL